VLDARALHFRDAPRSCGLDWPPAYVELWDERFDQGWTHHLCRGRRCAVAGSRPTAHFLAKLAHGLCDDLLSPGGGTTARRCPPGVVPAVCVEMWRTRPLSARASRRRGWGSNVLGQIAGSGACGEIGAGRMLEPLRIVHDLVGPAGPKVLAGRRVLITAGPTFERSIRCGVSPICRRARWLCDRARGGRSRRLGTLVAGPTALPTRPRSRRIDVLTAAQMLEAVMTQARQSEVFVSVAAVADWRVDQSSPVKLKKTSHGPLCAGPQSRHPGSGGKPALTALLRRVCGRDEQVPGQCAGQARCQESAADRCQPGPRKCLGAIRPSWCWWTSAPRHLAPGEQARTGTPPGGRDRSRLPPRFRPEGRYRPDSQLIDAFVTRALLANIVWHSLAGVHAPYSCGTQGARRYARASLQSWIRRTRNAPTFRHGAVLRGRRAVYCAGWSGPVPSGWHESMCMAWVIRWCGTVRCPPSPLSFAQHAWALRTCSRCFSWRPSPSRDPSRRKPSELGEYYGVFEGERLVAMAGERFQAGPLREIQRRLHAPGLPRSGPGAPACRNADSYEHLDRVTKFHSCTSCATDHLVAASRRNGISMNTGLRRTNQHFDKPARQARDLGSPGACRRR